MGEIIALVAKLIFRIGIVVASVTAFVLVLTFAIGLVAVSVNGTVLGDLFSLIQLWLPFNLGSLLAWIITASGLYITYRLTVVAVNYLSRFTS